MKKVLLATDGSTYSQQAVDFLSRLPHNEKLEVVVATVVSPLPVYRDASAAQWTDEHRSQQLAHADEVSRAAMKMFEGANASVTERVEEGPVGVTLVRMAEECDADLVVLGAKGHSAVDRILLGSVSDYVATHAKCSVLVVRPTEPANKTDHLEIAIGYEDAGPAQAAIEEFMEVKWGAQSNVHVVSVMLPFETFYVAKGHYVEDQQRISTALQRVSAELRASCPSVHTRVLENRHIGEGLVTFAEDHDCDLVVVGETPRSQAQRWLMGSVSRYVLRHAPGSVWITRNRMLNARK